MALRTIQGMAQVKENTREEIWQTARFLVTEMGSRNQIQRENLCTIIFSTTKDLNAACPSAGVSSLPFFTKNFIPMLDTQLAEIDGGLPMCMKILLFVDVSSDVKEIIHVNLCK